MSIALETTNQKLTSNVRNLSLLALVIQQTCVVLVIRYSKTRTHDATFIPYLSSVVIFSAELFKLVLNGSLEVISIHFEKDISAVNSQLSTKRSNLKTMFDVCNKESLKLVIPAILYVIQNNLLFYALSNLSVPTYQITAQGKLLMTAIISRIMLKKKITSMQYFAIFMLGMGVAMVNISDYQEKLGIRASAGSSDHSNGQQGNHWLGIVAVLVTCVTSGFAGVYTELVFKSTQQSVYSRNFQLAFYSLVLASMHILYTNFDTISKGGMFQGFDVLVVIIVIMQGIGGFLVSTCLKYADAVLKGFSLSIGVVLSTVASFFLFETSLNGMFLLGATMVFMAVIIYSHYGKDNAAPSSISKSRPKARNIFKTTLFFLMIISIIFIVITSIKNSYMQLQEVNHSLVSFAFDTPTDLYRDEPRDNLVSFAPCTLEDQHRDQPESLSGHQYTKVRQAEEIVAYIVTKLHKFGAPVTLLYGTALHEYRNGTGNCVQPYFHKDDYDIGVLKEHMHHFIMLLSEIDKRWKWKVPAWLKKNVKGLLFFYLLDKKN